MGGRGLIRRREKLEYCIKGTVRVILSEPLCKDENVRFTTKPLKSLSFQKYRRFSDSKSMQEVRKSFRREATQIKINSLKE